MVRYIFRPMLMRYSKRVCVLGACLSALMMSWPAQAQTTAQQDSADRVSRTPLPPLDDIDRQVITADSLAGKRWMVSGRDWSHYLRPGQCFSAMGVVQTLTMDRTGRREYIPNGDGDTLSTAAMAAGRACSAKMTARNVSSRQLHDLIAIALATNNLSLAIAAVDRRLAEASTPDQQGSVLADAISQAMQFHVFRGNQNGRERLAEPVHLAAADSFFSRFRILDSTARWWQVTALKEMYGADFDTARIADIGTRMKAVYATLSPADRDKAKIPDGYVRMLAVDEYRHTPIAESCKRAGDGMREHGLINGVSMKELGDGYDMMCRDKLGKIGTHVKQVPDGLWYPEGDTIRVATLVRPKPGRVTLIARPYRVNGLMVQRQGRIHPAIAFLKRLQSRYAENGLDVVLLDETVGFAWGSPPLEPDNEAGLLAWYYHDYLKLPMALNVYVTPYTRDEFGRRVEQPTPAQQQADLVLVDRNGRQYASEWVMDRRGINEEHVIEAFVRQALGLPLLLSSNK